MIQLAIDLQVAAVEQDWDEVSALLDLNAPDLSSSDYQIRVTDKEFKKYPIFNKDLSTNTFSGSIPAATANGYQAVPQTLQTAKGVITIAPGGNYTYIVTDTDILRQIAGDTYNFKDQVEVTYAKEIVISSISHQLISRAAYSAPVSVVQKLLEYGCCPNSNTKAYNDFSVKTSASIGVNSVSDGKYRGRALDNQRVCCESRPLLNAIRRSSSETAEALINHSCPCCGGGGAVVSTVLVEEAKKVGGELETFIVSAAEA
jgi:hypothetical protein